MSPRAVRVIMVELMGTFERAELRLGTSSGRSCVTRTSSICLAALDGGGCASPSRRPRPLLHPSAATTLSTLTLARFCLLLELAGEELFAVITRMHELRERDTACWISQLLSALEHMHGLQIAHCDVKPENVLLVSTGGGGLAATKLSDFGCARRVGVCAAPQGSRGYAAPEQRAGACVAACSVDLGVSGAVGTHTAARTTPMLSLPCPSSHAVSRGAACHRSTSCSRAPCPSSPPTTRAPASSRSSSPRRRGPPSPMRYAGYLPYQTYVTDQLPAPPRSLSVAPTQASP